MWVDSVIVVIIIFSLIQGFRCGFINTFIHTLGWVLAIILGFAWYPYVLDFLKNKTNFYETIQKKIMERIAENANSATESAVDGLPQVIKDVIGNATDAIANSLAYGLSNIIFNIIAFLVVALAIKLVLYIISSLFSKTSNEGVLGCIDGFLGLIAGGLKGFIIVYILLALLIPVTSLTDTEFIIDELNNSVLGSYLYENNLIFIAIKGFL